MGQADLAGAGVAAGAELDPVVGFDVADVSDLADAAAAVLAAGAFSELPPAPAVDLLRESVR